MQKKRLTKFDHLDHYIVARRTFERAFIIVRLVGFNPRKPHRSAAPGTIRVRDFLLRLLDVRVLHFRLPPYRWERGSVSLVTGTYDSVSAGDGSNLVLRRASLCAMPDFARK